MSVNAQIKAVKHAAGAMNFPHRHPDLTLVSESVRSTKKFRNYIFKSCLAHIRLRYELQQNGFQVADHPSQRQGSAMLTRGARDDAAEWVYGVSACDTLPL